MMIEWSYCTKCGSKLDLILAKISYHISDGTEQRGYDRVCKNYSCWKPWTWTHDNVMWYNYWMVVFKTESELK